MGENVGYKVRKFTLGCSNYNIYHSSCLWWLLYTYCLSSLSQVCSSNNNGRIALNHVPLPSATSFTCFLASYSHEIDTCALLCNLHAPTVNKPFLSLFHSPLHVLWLTEFHSAHRFVHFNHFAQNKWPISADFTLLKIQTPTQHSFPFFHCLSALTLSISITTMHGWRREEIPVVRQTENAVAYKKVCFGLGHRPFRTSDPVVTLLWFLRPAGGSTQMEPVCCSGRTPGTGEDFHLKFQERSTILKNYWSRWPWLSNSGLSLGCVSLFHLWFNLSRR